MKVKKEKFKIIKGQVLKKTLKTIKSLIYSTIIQDIKKIFSD